MEKQTEKHINIILGFHFHLPYGTRAEEYNELYEKRIKVLLSALFQYQDLPALIHFSGNVLYHIEREYPEMFMMLIDMIKRKQIELLSGGFYEPMMSLLQTKDRISQIEMLTTYISKNFGKHAKGCWLPDIAWDQSMPSVLNDCNIGWTFLDSKRWKSANIKNLEQCITEDRGKLVRVFPHAKNYRDLFETKNAKEALDEILQDCNKKSTFAIFLRTLYKKDKELTFEDALEFFDAISKTKEKIDWTLPSKIVKKNSSPKRAFFTTKNVKQFLLDNTAANNIYAKIIWNRSIVDMIKGDKIRKRRAQEKVCRTACYNLFCNNEDYEEEITSREYNGIEDPRLRAAAFSSALEAERIARDLKPPPNSIAQDDFTLEGKEEFVYQGDPLNCMISLSGGGIFELDYMPRNWNYLNTYNAVRSFTETLSPIGLSEDEVKNNPKAVRFCVNEVYDLVELDRTHGKLKLRTNEALSAPSAFANITIEKNYHIKNNTINISYGIKNSAKEAISFNFLSDLYLSFAADPSSDSSIIDSSSADPSSSCKGKNKLRINYYKEYKMPDDHSGKHLLAQDKHSASNIMALHFEDLHNEAIISLSGESKFNADVNHETHCGYYQHTHVLCSHPLKIDGEASTEIKLRLCFYN
ncbi:MAG: DUF1926 domain-containing protein [Termitinemataceae bacterium]|nr:MAG: DUF1926 domain-containing protein [Termitinemataceae bacterium]